MAEDSSIVAKAQPETVALFVSDLHLQQAMPNTATAFFAFLAQHAVKTGQLYLLGDLFEYWAGDDDMETPFHQQVITALRQVSDAGVALFWICGNRDFLIGQRFAQACAMTLLPDPYALTLAGQHLVLSHGDAACTDDLAYMAFRTQVRDPAWQQGFLSQPLEARKKIIEGVRMGSRAAQREKSAEIMDVNPQAITDLFDRTGASTMIHGHTHRPAHHMHQGRQRHVLSDWDLDRDGMSPRGDWLAMDGDGCITRHLVGKAVPAQDSSSAARRLA
ncbi:MAG: UDP-2,3-diacylglucosamine diphosphatase, partial [Janthinobacterium lividum]